MCKYLNISTKDAIAFEQQSSDLKKLEKHTKKLCKIEEIAGQDKFFRKRENMVNILVHGLGQTEKSWDKIIEKLNKSNIKAENPNLFELAKNYEMNYENINRFIEKIVSYCLD